MMLRRRPGMSNLKKIISAKMKEAQQNANSRPGWIKDAAKFEGVRSSYWHGDKNEARYGKPASHPVKRDKQRD